MFILTHPVNFPCGRKPEHPEKTHDFRHSVDCFFSHGAVARIELTSQVRYNTFFKTYHSILHTKSQLIFGIWSVDGYFHGRRAAHDFKRNTFFIFLCLWDRVNKDYDLWLISTPENKQRIGPDQRFSDPLRSNKRFPVKGQVE